MTTPIRACFLALAATLAMTATTGCGPKSEVAIATDESIDPTTLDPVPIENRCKTAAFVQFAERPSETPRESVVIDPGRSIQQPRNAKGFLDVWLVDEAGKGRGYVHITRQEHKVWIHSDCRAIEGD